MSRLALDRLDEGAAQVVLLRDARFGGERAREPHRHDYHELIWVRAGRGRAPDRRRGRAGAARAR